MRGGFISQLAIPVELFHYERLQWIEREDLSGVRARVQHEYGKWSGAKLDSGLDYLRRYYAMLVLDPLNYHAMPKALDPFYHAHVLFAQDFAFFCARVFRQQLHHQPLPPSDPHVIHFVRDLYVYTHGIQPKLFHELDAEWWPAPDQEDPFCWFFECTDRILREHALLPRSPRRLSLAPRA